MYETLTRSNSRGGAQREEEQLKDTSSEEAGNDALRTPRNRGRRHDID